MIPNVPLPDEGTPVSAKHFVQMLDVNADNEKLSDKDFRQFVRNTLPIVEYPRLKENWQCKLGLHDWKNVPHPLTIFAGEERCQVCDRVRKIPPDLSALDGI